MTRSKCAALALLVAASPAAQALQTVTARDGETVLAKIAQKDVTRIAVDQGRIRKVTGNAGEFVLEKDEEAGQVFLRPADPTATRPIHVFVTSDRGTVGLLLQPVDAPGESLVIQTRASAEPRSLPAVSAPRHVRALKNLLLALATDAVPDDMDVRESATELAFWPGLRMTLERSYLGAAIVGERYLVANLTSTEARLEPRDLHKPGVMAVSVEHTDLAPGAATAVFVLRERRPHD